MQIINGVLIEHGEWQAHKGALLNGHPLICHRNPEQPKKNSGILNKISTEKNSNYEFIVSLRTDSDLTILVFDADKKLTLAEGRVVEDGRYLINFSTGINEKVYVGILFNSPTKSEGVVDDFFELLSYNVLSYKPNTSPYKGVDQDKFWRSGVVEKHFYDYRLPPLGINLNNLKIATAGSCFAQHISRHLKTKSVEVLDLEPKPDWMDMSEQVKYGFGLYSCRYGNIYTVRQLLQLLQESQGERLPKDIIWSKEGRFFDALRPSVTPNGHANSDEILLSRKYHLEKVRTLWEKLNVFVFTLGLTESWESIEDGTIYPTAPGTVAGVFDPNRYRFKNFSYPEIYEDLSLFYNGLRKLNPSAKVLLTVSPVPLTATASNKHILVANSHSKSILRAVAGQFSIDFKDVFYFPSYELITSPASRSVFYNPDLRTVNSFGVDYVMSNFSSEGGIVSDKKALLVGSSQGDNFKIGLDLLCDDELLDKFNIN